MIDCRFRNADFRFNLERMDKKDLQKRFKSVAINTTKLCLKLPYNVVNKIYNDQIIRSSSSSAADYRSACRGKSKPDFINKLKTVEEEVDETMFFFEMLAEFNNGHKKELRILYIEANELLSIIVSSINTANSNMVKEKSTKIRNPKI